MPATSEPRGAGQRGDDSFELPATGPATFPAGAGPVVKIDEAHRNYHTLDGRYRAFAELLRRDGYRVSASESPLGGVALTDVDVLVISNALSEENASDWSLPNHSAFTLQEIQALEAWVARGGSLLLIADHMPMPGAVADLAAAFGLSFHDGFAYGPDGESRLSFALASGTLAAHEVTSIAGGGEIPFVTTFTGQAFRAGEGVDVAPLMTFPEGSYQLLPTKAWEFTEETPRMPAGGLLQGALVRHGDGRVAAFGEAAAFTAQLQRDGDPMGMNHPSAPHNARFLLNVMRWLAVREGASSPAEER